MAGGVHGNEDPDLSPQLDRYIKRRVSPLLVFSIFTAFQRGGVVYETAGAARGPLAMVMTSLYY